MKIGVSSCLVGNMCRYDGATSTDRFVVDILKNYFEIEVYCPEEDVFGTPRESIALRKIDGETRVITNFTKMDVTNKLQGSSQNIIDRMKDEVLCGFILKSKSPSCGMERVKVYAGENNMSEKKGVGVFAADIKTHFPLLPVEEDGRLNDPWLKENFLMQVFAHSDLLTFLNTNPKHKELIEFHTSYKYLIYAKSQKSYKELGHIVANHEKKDINTILEEYKFGFLTAIAQKSSIKKTYNVLLHILGYFKRDIITQEKEFILDACAEYKNGIIPLITVIKLLNLYVLRYDEKYLKTQKFLNPYPKEFALRSDIKAYK
ncbi:MAG: hypothetical protein ACI81I_000945 [Arcobacteraceae bacterium]|jgi:uncharacterized protein YbgA (DUF1722 family)/uncharacterized protein YbbK (DUF523 family)